MKPLMLSMQAFGPFSGRQDIDFAALGERAFFLIHGPTGAGKTTLLDALCFALYGDTSGGERRAQDMRSDHAERAVSTWVDLIFQLGAERYRVKRSPTQERPKQRGEGMLTEQAKAELHQWLDGAWKPLETQASRVDERIRCMLGFDSAQFRQVIVLPQGRFRELLTADSKTRQQILERLFRTEIYRRIEEALKSEVAAIKAQAEKLAIEKRAILGIHGLESEELLVQTVAFADAEVKASIEREQHARLTTELAARALQQGEAAAAALKERDSAYAAQAALLQRGPEITRLKERLAAARLAQAVQPADLAMRQIRQEWERAQASFPQTEAEVQRAEAALAQATSMLQAAHATQSERVGFHKRIASLEGLVARVEALARAKEAEWRAAEALEKTEVEEAIKKETLQSLEARCSAAQKEYDEASRSAGRLDVLRLNIKTLQARKEKLEALSLSECQLIEARARERATKDAELRATEAVVHAREKLAQTERDWIKGQSARLAAQLAENQPCPVCGSVTHPKPALHEQAQVSDQILEAAREALACAEAAQNAARQRSYAASIPVLQGEERIRGLLAEFGDSFDRKTADANLASTLDSLLKDEASAVADQARCTELATELTQLGAGVEKARAAHEAAQARTRAARDEHVQNAGVLKGALEAVPEQWRDPLALANAIDEARKSLTELEESLTVAQAKEREATSALSASKARRDAEASALARTAEQHEAASLWFADALAKAGFGNAAAYAEACLPLEEQEAGARSVSSFEAALTSADDRVARALQACTGLEVPNLDALREAASTASALHETLIRQVQDATAGRDALLRSQANLVALNNSGQEIEARYAVLGRLSEIANGNNPRRMTFQRFVLATLLDEVLEAASLRLRRMSRSRYELRRVMQQGDLRQAGGLDLEVFDHETGAARPANTLSGGEGFLASLSLALGLADVVQSRAGGIQMETLFVDEGFGTLDPESLDFAIRTLIDLQKAGRLVGIISHVAELRERIDVRLEIKPSKQGGSTIEMRMP